VGEGPIGCDISYPDSLTMPEEIARLRYSLTPGEQSRYRWLGERAALALEQTLMQVRPGEKECEVVGRLCAEPKDRRPCRSWPPRMTGSPGSATRFPETRVDRF
jgi:hypothetical protein